MSVCLSLTRTFRLIGIAILESETLKCLHQVQNVTEKWDLWQDNQSFLTFNFPSRVAEQASICQRNDSWGLPAFGCLDADRLTRLRHAQILAFGSECQQEIRSLSKQTRHFRCSDSIIWIGSRSKLLYVNGTILKDCPHYRYLRTQDCLYFSNVYFFISKRHFS